MRGAECARGVRSKPPRESTARETEEPTERRGEEREREERERRRLAGATIYEISLSILAYTIYTVHLLWSSIDIGGGGLG